jgi:hypothetical protein
VFGAEVFGAEAVQEVFDGDESFRVGQASGDRPQAGSGVFQYFADGQKGGFPIDGFEFAVVGAQHGGDKTLPLQAIVSESCLVGQPDQK